MHLTKEIVYPAAAALVAFAGAVTDLRSRRIPNLLTGPAILFGLMLHLALDGWHGLLYSLLAGLICGGIFVVFFLAGGMGAGDVKLITAIGCLAGLTNSPSVLVFTAIAGGVMGVAFALSRGQLKQTLFNVAALANHHRDAGLTPHPDLNVTNTSTLRLPYGLAIAAGCAVTLLFQTLSLQGVKR
jgi:prepilin peptidase CpaA